MNIDNSYLLMANNEYNFGPNCLIVAICISFLDAKALRGRNKHRKIYERDYMYFVVET